MHILAKNCSEKASSCMFPEFLQYAKKTGFDFSKRNSWGKTVLKLAEENKYENHCFGILIDVTDNGDQCIKKF